MTATLRARKRRRLERNRQQIRRGDNGPQAFFWQKKARRNNETFSSPFYVCLSREGEKKCSS